MKNFSSTWPADQLNKASQITNNSFSKFEKLRQSNKLNKIKLNIKTLEALTPQAKFDPFKYTYFENMFKTNFCLLNWSRTNFDLQGLHQLFKTSNED